MAIRNYIDEVHSTPGGDTAIIHLLRRQLLDVKREGIPVIARKACTLSRMLPDAVPGVLLGLVGTLAVRLLRPVVLIRLGPIRSPNFGHFAGEPEVYLSKRKLGLDNQHSTDIHYYTSRPGTMPISNWQLKRMWDRKLTVNRLARWPDWVNRAIPGGSAHMIPPRTTRDIHGTLARTTPHLAFNAAEEERGRAWLREVGVPEGTPFVCFHARDPVWLQSIAPGKDFDYHRHRDSNINKYIQAVNQLVELGYYAFRMGSVVEKPLELPNQKDRTLIIDYAANGMRTDFADIFLGANCRFFIGSAAGITELPKIFRRPILSVNQIPMGWTHSWSPNDIFIPKKLWLRSEKRYLTFTEILKTTIGFNLIGDQYLKFGLDPIENTSEEIAAVTMEMEQRIAGTWHSSNEDEELQARFWNIYKGLGGHSHAGEPLHGVMLSRIGADFLRQNHDLLD